VLVTSSSTMSWISNYVLWIDDMFSLLIFFPICFCLSLTRYFYYTSVLQSSDVALSSGWFVIKISSRNRNLVKFFADRQSFIKRYLENCKHATAYSSLMHKNIFKISEDTFVFFVVVFLLQPHLNNYLNFHMLLSPLKVSQAAVWPIKKLYQNVSS